MQLIRIFSSIFQKNFPENLTSQKQIRRITESALQITQQKKKKKEKRKTKFIERRTQKREGKALLKCEI